MVIIKNVDFDMLHNEAEQLVIAELDRQLQLVNRPICLCKECILDMAAKALNMVKPLYRVSLLGELYTSRAMDENEYAATVRDSVSSAIEKVRVNPGHETGN